VIVNGLKKFNNIDKILMKSHLTNSLWLIYQNTWFKPSKLPENIDNLCIITAFNPWGNPRVSEENNYQNRELAHELMRSKIEYYEICAGNQDFSYFEPSFLVRCSKQKGLALARSWQQNAIFWIEQSQLYLLPCQPLIIDDKEVKQAHLGEFMRRVRR